MRNLFLKIFAIDRKTIAKVNDKVWKEFLYLKKKELIIAGSMLIGIFALFHYPAKYMSQTVLKTVIEPVDAKILFKPSGEYDHERVAARVSSRVKKGTPLYLAIAQDTANDCNAEDEECGREWAKDKIIFYDGNSSILVTNILIGPRVSKHLGFLKIDDHREGKRYWQNIIMLSTYYFGILLIWLLIRFFIYSNMREAIKISKGNKQ